MELTTLPDCKKHMTSALDAIRRGGTVEALDLALKDLDTAIACAAGLPSTMWDDARIKAQMIQVALIGRNAKAARQIITSLACDLEHLPQTGALPC